MPPSGLSSADAARVREQVGPNQVRQRGGVSIWSGVWVQLRDPLVLVLMAAWILTMLTGDLTDAAVIATVIVVNTAVGVYQEIKADRAITALATLTTPSVRVQRDGVEVSLPSADLVPGDLIVLGEGDIVPADCDLADASALVVDESALTGESVPVPKTVRQSLSSGTTVLRGRALGLVTATGADSALGQIASLLDSRVQITPLQQRLAGLGRVLAITAVALCAMVLFLGLARGQSLELMAITAVSLAVAAVPESLPAVVTLSLALGARRMAARHAVVRRLPAVETLGSVTVLATDKTGTLTQATMVVEQVCTPSQTVLLSGDGYAPIGEASCDGRPLNPAHSPDVVELLRAAALCNDAALIAPQGPETQWQALGDPTEAALLSAAGKVGLDKKQLDMAFPRVGEVPFDSASQQMTTVHRVAPDQLLVVSKGSVEALHEQHGNGAHRDRWRGVLDHGARLASQGYRVLAISVAEPDAASGWEDGEHRLLGLVAMNDPTKPAARSTIEQCRAAGITPVLITGDHPATARAVAARVGVLSADEAHREDAVATGAQIAAGEVPDLTAVRVFARTSPEQKLDIIQAWKDRGEIVAMTGDGVNDGPALHRSDIGVAMGQRGTEVARQAADLVLADDDLATVVAAVEEGRRVYANIRRFLVFGLSGGAAEILVMLLGPFGGLGLPLLAAQILWINLLTHGLTGVALGAEPVEPELMRHPPRPPDQSVLGDGLWQRVLGVAATLSLVTLAVGVWAHETGRPWQTMIFVSLVCLQLGVALGLRPRLFTRNNPLLPAAVAGSFLLALAGVYVPFFQTFLGTVALSATDLTIAAATAALGWVTVRLTARRLEPATHSPRPQLHERTSS